MIRRDVRIPSGASWLGTIFFWGSPGIGKTLFGTAISKIFLVRRFYPDEDLWKIVIRYIQNIHREDQLPEPLQDKALVAWMTKRIMENALMAGISGNLMDILKGVSMEFPVEASYTGVIVFNPTFVGLDPSTLEPVDVRGGVVTVEDETGRQYSMVTIPVDFKPIIRIPMGVVLIDDLPLSNPGVMTALRLILQEGRIHAKDKNGQQIMFPPGWRMLITGNFPQQSTMAAEVPDLVRNRFIHICMDVPDDDYDWLAVRNDEGGQDQMAEEDEERKKRMKDHEMFILDKNMMRHLHPDVASFLIHHRKYARMSTLADELAFPTVRTISYVSAIMKEYIWFLSTRRLNESQRDVLELVKNTCITGAIGAQAADDFLKFISTVITLRVPQAPDILRNGIRCISAEFMSGSEIDRLQKAFNYAIRHWAQAFHTSLLHIERKLTDAGLLDESTVGLNIEREEGEGAVVLYAPGNPKHGVRFSADDFRGLENSLEVLLEIIRRKMNAERKNLSGKGIVGIALNDQIYAHTVDVLGRVKRPNIIFQIGKNVSDRMRILLDELDRIIGFKKLLVSVEEAETEQPQEEQE